MTFCSEREEDPDSELDLWDEEKFLPARAGRKTKFMATHTVGENILSSNFRAFIPFKDDPVVMIHAAC